MNIDALPTAQLRLLVERMQEGAVTFSRAGIILYCNERFAALVKRPAQSLIGSSIQRFLDDWVTDALQLSSDSPNFPRTACRVSVRTEDGTVVPASMLLEELPGNVQQPAVLCATFIDLTAGSERGLQEALGQLAGSVAHDFNNLLQVLSGGLQVIGKQLDQARRDRVAGAMSQAIERGARLCRELLAFSRRQDLNAQPIDLKGLIEGMRELLDQGLLPSVRMEYDFPANLWPVEVDAGELELVIVNLARNARDALPAGGLIRLAARNAPGLQEHGLNGDFVRIDIRDDGIGMTPEELAHVFEPFFTNRHVGRGSGLGLAQAHGFARASGGAIKIASTANTALRGTTASLFLPRTLRTPGIIVKMDTAEESVVQASGQVLLVEDDDQVAELTVEMIKQLGYDATRVASAEAALGALAERRHVDIVFSDVMMPGRMNGVQLAQEIRRRRPGLPVLLTSGYIEPSNRSAAQPTKIIAKPYHLEQLRDALAAATRDARNSVREH
jgi:PAS domain S-box-containing protein